MADVLVEFWKKESSKLGALRQLLDYKEDYKENR